MNYEVDKMSGYLRVDRPQRSSASIRALYGFVPRTYYDERVRRLAPAARRGDGDPLDICVLERAADRPQRDHRPARVIGGLQMIDRGEATTRSSASSRTTTCGRCARRSATCRRVLIERLQHYFLTYKLSRRSARQRHRHVTAATTR